MSTVALVSLDGIIDCGRTSFEIVTKLFMALKKNVISRYSCQKVIGGNFKVINLSLYVSAHTNGNFKMDFVARRWIRSVLVILMNKLYLYGVKGPALRWFKSYLMNREQVFKIDNIINIDTKEYQMWRSPGIKSWASPVFIIHKRSSEFLGQLCTSCVC